MAKSFSAFMLSLAGLCAAAQAHAVTIETHETERFFFKDGRYTKFDGQFENTYHYDETKNTLTRTRVYDYRSKRVTPDQTSFYIQRTLNSHPGNAERYGLPPVLRAVGRPDPDTLEILVIGEDTVQSAISTGTSVIVSRAQRLK